MSDTESVLGERPVRCSNCGADKSGNYCSMCGQNSRNYLRAAHRVLMELIAETFDLDSRVFRSLRYLMFHPGFLTNEFSTGKRASYLSPGRMYLVISVVFFFLLTVMNDDAPAETQAIVQDIETSLDDPEVAAFVASLSDNERERLIGVLEARGIDAADVLEKSPETAAPQGQVAYDGNFDAVWRDRALRLLEDPGGVEAQLLDNLPVTIFVLLPVFALLLKMMYGNRFYSEHLVFALHLHAFAFTVFSVLVLLPQPETWAGNPSAAILIEGVRTALLVGCAVYAFLALRRVYGGSLWSAGAKYLALAFGYSVVLSIGLSFMTVATLYAY